MQNNAKRKLVGGILYVFLAFMLVTLLCVGLLTALTGGLDRAKKQNGSVTDAPVTTAKPEPKESNDTADTPESTAPQTSAKPEPDTPIDAVPYAYAMPLEGYVSKNFDIEQAVYSLTMDDYRVHTGIDIEGEVGSGVSAFAEGTVSYVSRDSFMGYTVCIEHSGGMKSYYMNLSSDMPDGIETGAAVSCGQLIGYVGDSAAVEAAQTPHLHFEVTVNGKKIDPLEYLDYDASLYPTDSTAEG
ncbi:MAG: M23 family metallopeptidase [Clostridia bacterium]|nr:M23 family metallopeptidase [Clostridia bacterium]